MLLSVSIISFDSLVFFWNMQLPELGHMRAVLYEGLSPTELLK